MSTEMTAAGEPRDEAVSGLAAPYAKLRPGPGIPAREVSEHQRTRIFNSMITIVADRGYQGVKVRDIVKLAGVSTRAFYQHFDSKEDCFLRTYEYVVRNAMRSMASMSLGQCDWSERLQQIYILFARALAGDPQAARLALVEVYVAGPAALEQARIVENSVEKVLGEALVRTPDSVRVPDLIVEGIMAGVARVARVRLLADRQNEMLRLSSELMNWVLCYFGDAANELAGLDALPMRGPIDLEASPLPSDVQEDRGWPLSADRDIILASVSKLIAAVGYKALTIKDIRLGAGVSRVAFDTHFTGVEDCFLAALEDRAEKALSQAIRAQEAGKTWPGGVYRAISGLCNQIARDPLLAGICLTDDFVPGSNGSMARARLIAAVVEQLRSSIPLDQRTSELVFEASTGALWGLFHHYVIRDWSMHRPPIAATLSFLVLAPTIGSRAAIEAIRSEQ